MIGPLEKVLREVAATIREKEDGELILAWRSAHGRRVVEVVGPTSASSEAVVTGDEPVDYVQVGGLLPAKASEEPQPTKKPAANPVLRAIGRSFADAWHVVWQPKESK